MNRDWSGENTNGDAREEGASPFFSDVALREERAISVAKKIREEILVAMRTPREEGSS